MFIVGGASYQELQALQNLAAKKDVEIILGTVSQSAARILNCGSSTADPQLPQRRNLNYLHTVSPTTMNPTPPHATTHHHPDPTPPWLILIQDATLSAGQLIDVLGSPAFAQ